MRLLHRTFETGVDHKALSQFTRKAVRAIVLRGEDILLLYTQRYQDYSLPGGGVNDDETLQSALQRELAEETGAKGITNIVPFGEYEEYRHWHNSDYALVHMRSFCFTCSIDAALGTPQLEDYEQANGMRPVWKNIHQAIAHNQRTIDFSDKKGQSIERETFLLKRIAAELL